MEDTETQTHKATNWNLVKFNSVQKMFKARNNLDYNMYLVYRRKNEDLNFKKNKIKVRTTLTMYISSGAVEHLETEIKSSNIKLFKKQL